MARLRRYGWTGTTAVVVGAVSALAVIVETPADRASGVLIPVLIVAQTIAMVVVCLFLLLQIRMTVELWTRLYGLRRQRPEVRSRTLVQRAGLLLPASERERYVEEWLDHVEAARENGEDVRPVVRSIVLRALPRLVLRTWMRHLGAVLARP